MTAQRTNWNSAFLKLPNSKLSDLQAGGLIQLSKGRVSNKLHWSADQNNFKFSLVDNRMHFSLYSETCITPSGNAVVSA